MAVNGLYIALASTPLDFHQVKYIQIEKEGLDIIFDGKGFHRYLYGDEFIPVTDGKPLVRIVTPTTIYQQ